MPAAWAELGQRETAGASSNPRIAGYFRRAGHPSVTDDAVPWCAAFVGACLEATGFKGSRSLAARSYLAWGVAADTPAFGAITVLSRGSDPAAGHVGFLVGRTERSVVLLGGNQSDAVTVAAFDAARVLGYRLPATAEMEAVAQPDSLLFAAALEHVLHFEGGWSDDPFDPGGATNKGITIGVLSNERGIPLTSQTIEALKSELRRISDDEVRRIYLERYWQPARCPELAPPIAFMHFDAAVNQGVGRASRMLQQALGVDIDGQIGPITIAAARRQDAATCVARYADIRRQHYQSLSHFWRFGRGWLRRLDATAKTAGSLARGSPPLPTSPTINQETTAMPEAENPYSETQTKTTGKWWGESLTIWGAIVTSISTVAPTILAAMGIDISGDLIQRLGNDMLLTVQAAGGLVGTIMTIVGRVRAVSALERRALSWRL
jgi:uncharacterized protein (TIGR02594 family)